MYYDPVVRYGTLLAPAPADFATRAALAERAVRHSEDFRKRVLRRLRSRGSVKPAGRVLEHPEVIVDHGVIHRADSWVAFMENLASGTTQPADVDPFSVLVRLPGVELRSGRRRFHLDANLVLCAADRSVKCWSSARLLRGDSGPASLSIKQVVSAVHDVQSVAHVVSQTVADLYRQVAPQAGAAQATVIVRVVNTAERGVEEALRKLDPETGFGMTQLLAEPDTPEAVREFGRLVGAEGQPVPDGMKWYTHVENDYLVLYHHRLSGRVASVWGLAVRAAAALGSETPSVPSSRTAGDRFADDARLRVAAG